VSENVTGFPYVVYSDITAFHMFATVLHMLLLRLRFIKI